jgi:hypothetical protein
LARQRSPFLQQLNDAPSLYLDFARGGREGFEHIGFWFPDVTVARERLEKAGLTLCYEITGAAERVVYCEPPSE